MSCGLEPIVGQDRADFEGWEDEVGTCDVVHVGYYPLAEALHAAAVEILGLAPQGVDANYYWDEARAQEYYSLWYYRRR